ncbi:Signal peptidase I [Lentibacillus sp. JNUCC-1]|uniref:signal peptidase I n=1 Tax=Lentibacillus sp. JNUCC-1 TaxID=2654513 RepID=UPI0012E7A6B7|nr:signal peptidase I [Lentibacillus sp. JNUCC-1]MUV39984.1 Signal peptidase I [Lentibacillus sp. JNUCC-1]
MIESKNDWLEWVKALLIAVLLAVVIKTYFFTPIIVDGPSMKPTLSDRDQMIVNKFAYRVGEPKRFDIVVFHASEQKDFIKRIIGLPGEHVAVKDNVLYINGEAIEESFLNQNDYLYTWESDFVLEDLPGGYEQIPEGHYLVLGDNRNNSTDSRVFGVIDGDEIVGKTNLIYWPLKRIQIVGE